MAISASLNTLSTDPNQIEVLVNDITGFTESVGNYEETLLNGFSQVHLFLCIGRRCELSYLNCILRVLLFHYCVFTDKFDFCLLCLLLPQLQMQISNIFTLVSLCPFEHFIFCWSRSVPIWKYFHL